MGFVSHNRVDAELGRDDTVGHAVNAYPGSKRGRVAIAQRPCSPARA
ncbi:hypothetical protein [Agromyces binzhouensis]|nr:hypothetical protein [Agromyces binzhouensis]